MSRAGRRACAGFARASAPGVGLAIFLLAVLGQPAHAQFGRNKLQHQVFDFQTIRTAHFDVYYYPEEREAALDAARMAERSYARLSRLLGHEFEERKPIIVYASHSHFQQTNALPGFINEGTGGVTEFAKRRVILPLTGSYADFEHILTHELVHAFQFDVIATGLASQLNPFPFRPSLWFMEGMAEYLSIGKLDTHTHAWLRDAVMSGYLRTIAQMSQRDDYLSYRFGQSLWAFIGAKYGDETIGLILQRAMRLGIEAAFVTTLGVSLAQLSEDWVESVRTTYLPEAARFAGAEDVGRALTRHVFRPGSDAFASYLAPALSPDGREIVFLSDRSKKLYSFFHLWLASAEDGEIITRLVEAARTPDFKSLRFLNSSAAWSPDGRRLAFVAQVGGRDALYIYDVPRRRVVRRITVELDAVRNPTFSPDGERVAFTGLSGGISDLYVVDVRGERFQQLTDDKYADLHPAWSPDGRHIAITTDRGEGTDFDELAYGNFRIGLYSFARSDVELLPYQEDGKNVNPVWSPDGEAIAFVSDRTGVNDIFIWSRVEKRLYQLTNLLSGVSGITPSSPAISWAAEADRLAFTYFEGAGYNIYLVDNPRAQAWPVEASPTPALVALTDDHGLQTGGQPIAHNTSGAGLEYDYTSLATISQSYYKIAGGFRPSATQPAAEEQVSEREVTVASLLRNAHLGLPDTSSFELSGYKVKLTPDIIGRPVIGAQVGGYFDNGVYGGSYIVLSDMLGNHNVLLSGQIAGSLNDAFIVAQYAYLRERVNLSMSYQQFPVYRFRGTSVLNLGGSSVFVEDRFLRDVIRSLTTKLHYPFNEFQRVEFSLTGAYISRDSVVDQLRVTATSSAVDRSTHRVESFVLTGPSLALVWDNTLFGYTGPIAGRRYRVEVARYFGDFDLSAVNLDFRNYWNFRRQFSFATRLVSLWRAGRSVDEARLYWGSPYFIRGYDRGSFSADECVESVRQVDDPVTSACPVRDQLIGSSVAFLNTEFRLPIFNFLDFWVVPLGLPPVDAMLFFDVGVAYDSIDQLVRSRGAGADPFDLRSPVGAYGAGLRINILYSVLRLDYAVPLNRPNHSGGIWSISFGPTF